MTKTQRKDFVRNRERNDYYTAATRRMEAFRATP